MTAGPVLCLFEDGRASGVELADALGIGWQLVECHRFPDGESRVRLDPLPSRALVYRSLDQPNDKLIELLLLGSVLRSDAGPRPMLIAPYLPYMRQDAAFRSGEAISQLVIGQLLAAAYGTIVTADPHLHRTHSLGAVFPNAEAIAVTAAPLLAALIDRDPGEAPLLVGPDGESETLVASVARRAGAQFLTLDKVRQSDTAVVVGSSELAVAHGRRIVLIDDIVSTGATLCQAARRLRETGCGEIEALVVHALFDETVASAMRAAGIGRVRSTDSVPHATNAMHLAPILADAVRDARSAVRSM
jgi:ribose-phosphate pyrophosphokinase